MTTSADRFIPDYPPGRQRKTLVREEITSGYRQHRGSVRAIDDAVKRIWQEYIAQLRAPGNQLATFVVKLEIERADG